MDWWLALILILGAFLVLMFLGMPVAFAFLTVNAVAVYFLWGGVDGLGQLVRGMWTSVATFTLLPVPLFIMMGDVMFRAGIAKNMIDALDKWLGKLPGRLALLAVGAGVVFATLSGSILAGVAVLGSSLEPEMERRGYSKTMSAGPILGSGILAAMIPPSALAVILASLGLMSVGKLLIAIIMPGLLMAALYVIYIVGRCVLQPTLAPAYDTASFSLREKIGATLKYVVPLSSIIFLVIGLILLGVATPSEAAALGAAGCFVLAAAYRLLTWKVTKATFVASLESSGMVFLIFVSAITFSQVLAFTGASSGLVGLALGLEVAPLVIILLMQLIVLMMGMFMESMAILMITLPIYIPVIKVLGFDPVWFGTMMLINVVIAPISPPFGLGLFVMRGVAPNLTMKDIYMAAIPFCIIDFIAIILIMFFPAIALWLPNLVGAG